MRIWIQMNKTTRWASRCGRAASLLGAATVVCSVLVLAGGCGPEKQTLVAPPPNGTVPGGADPDEYRRMMQGGGKGGGPGAPGGAPSAPR